jgi:hypothetical protein
MPSPFPWITFLPALGRWKWGFNDPSLMGWGLTLGYLMTAWACGAAARRSPGPQLKSQRLGWILLGSASFLLALNKQFDLQNLLRDRAREWFLHQPWYASRRYVIAVGLITVMVTLLAGAWALWRKLPPTAGSLRRALTGFAALGITVALRFLPVPALSRWLGFAFFESGAPVWQFHAVEVLELGLMAWILWQAVGAWKGGKGTGEDKIVDG